MMDDPQDDKPAEGETPTGDVPADAPAETPAEGDTGAQSEA